MIENVEHHVDPVTFEPYLTFTGRISVMTVMNAGGFFDDSGKLYQRVGESIITQLKEQYFTQLKGIKK